MRGKKHAIKSLPGFQRQVGHVTRRVNDHRLAWLPEFASTALQHVLAMPTYLPLSGIVTRDTVALYSTAWRNDPAGATAYAIKHISET